MDLTITCDSVSIEKYRNGVSVTLNGIDENDLNTPEVAECCSSNLSTILDKHSIDDVLGNYNMSDILDYIGEAIIISEARKYKINDLL